MCATCAFFAKDLKVSGENPTHDGFCHFTSPQMLAFPSPGGKTILKAMFPPVSNNEWCGQFVPDSKAMQ